MEPLEPYIRIHVRDLPMPYKAIMFGREDYNVNFRFFRKKIEPGFSKIVYGITIIPVVLFVTGIMLAVGHGIVDGVSAGKLEAIHLAVLSCIFIILCGVWSLLIKKASKKLMERKPSADPNLPYGLYVFENALVFYDEDWRATLIPKNMITKVSSAKATLKKTINIYPIIEYEYKGEENFLLVYMPIFWEIGYIDFFIKWDLEISDEEQELTLEEFKEIDKA